MYEEFLMGVMCGLAIGVYVFLFSDLLARIRYKEYEKEDKMETIKKTTELPQIHTVEDDIVSIAVYEYVPSEKHMTSHDEWYKKDIDLKLQARMIEKIWKFVKIEVSKDQNCFQDIYTAKLRIYDPIDKNLLYELTTQEY